eukprot:NODE_121_length_17861_cov_0.498480.p16 type:complete len:129 gc:universal NODE_121_length_17861_cov_0.498480:3593-3207(-)
MAKSIRSKSRRVNAAIRRKQNNLPVEQKRMMDLDKYQIIKEKLPKIVAPHLIDNPFREILIDSKDAVQDRANINTIKTLWNSEAKRETTQFEFMQVENTEGGTVWGAKEKRMAKRARKSQKKRNHHNK